MSYLLRLLMDSTTPALEGERGIYAIADTKKNKMIGLTTFTRCNADVAFERLWYKI